MSKPAEISHDLLSRLAPDMLAALAQCHIIPHYLGYAASHATSIATGEISQARGGTWITRDLIMASTDDPYAPQKDALMVVDSIDRSVQGYELMAETFREKGIVRGLLSLPFAIEHVADNWFNTFGLSMPSKRVIDYILP